jgi:hypothetical protein
MDKTYRYINSRPIVIIGKGKFKGLPRCILPGCQNPRKILRKELDNTIVRSNVCLDHENTDLITFFSEYRKLQLEKELKIAKNAGFDNVYEHRKHKMLKMANKAGFNTISEYSKHKELLRAKKRGFISTTELTKSVVKQTATNFGFASRKEYLKVRNSEKAKKLGFKNYYTYKKSRRKIVNE